MNFSFMCSDSQSGLRYINQQTDWRQSAGIKPQRINLLAPEFFDPPHKNRVIAALILRVRRTLEHGGSAGENRATAKSRLKAAGMGLELILGGARKMHRQRAVGSAQYMNRKNASL